MGEKEKERDGGERGRGDIVREIHLLSWMDQTHNIFPCICSVFYLLLWAVLRLLFLPVFYLRLPFFLLHFCQLKAFLVHYLIVFLLNYKITLINKREKKKRGGRCQHFHYLLNFVLYLVQKTYNIIFQIWESCKKY